MKKSAQKKRAKAEEHSGLRKSVAVKQKGGGTSRNRVGVHGLRVTKAKRSVNERKKERSTREREPSRKKKVRRTVKKSIVPVVKKKRMVKKTKRVVKKVVAVAKETVVIPTSDEKKPTAATKKRKQARKRTVRSDAGSTRLTRVDAFKRIKELPNFDVVHHKLVSNVSPQSIATFIQDDCGLCEDITHSSMVVLLYRYKRSIPYEERKPKEMTALARRTEQFPHELSVLEEITRLYELQTTRVAQLIDLEDEAGEPLRALGVEMDRGMKYLEQIAELKSKLGLIGDHGEQKSSRDLGETLVSGAMAVIQKKYGDGAQAKLAFIGKKLHEALQSITVADGKTIVGRTKPATTLVSTTKSGVEVHEAVPARPDRSEGPQPGPGEGVVPPAPDLPTEGDS
ncbi:MAG: hypothetical protein J3T61_05745 [Candidatus Brocadiales bacterium]|nr:hypothetical protein [Candidatus Bathyanammoxibius sp.]